MTEDEAIAELIRRMDAELDKAMGVPCQPEATSTKGLTLADLKLVMEDAEREAKRICPWRELIGTVVIRETRMIPPGYVYELPDPECEGRTAVIIHPDDLRTIRKLVDQDCRFPVSDAELAAMLAWRARS